MEREKLRTLLLAYLKVFDQAFDTRNMYLNDACGFANWRHLAAAYSEESEEFASLVDQASVLANQSPRSVRSRVITFMRRSGAYFPQRDDEGILDALMAHLTGTGSVQITYLIGFPWISQNLRLSVKNESFKLVRLTTEEISQVIANDVRRSFYSVRALGSTETDLLSLVGLLMVSDSKERLQPGTVRLDFSVLGGSLSYTDLPEAVEIALGATLLLDWQLVEEDLDMRESWFPGYPVGLFACLDDDWFSVPAEIGISDLGYDIGDGFPFASGPKFTCADSGQLAEFHRRITRLTSDSRNRFLVGRALRFFARACLLDPYAYPPAKMDQILWLVVALDALAGDSCYGSSGRLATRIGHLTGCDCEESRELYNCRSRLVHGDRIGEVPVGLSWFGFDVARKALRESIRILDDQSRRGRTMTRKEFLTYTFESVEGLPREN